MKHYNVFDVLSLEEIYKLYGFPRTTNYELLRIFTKLSAKGIDLFETIDFMLIIKMMYHDRLLSEDLIKDYLKNKYEENNLK